MTRAVTVLDEAEADLTAAAAWYDDCHPGVGADFRAGVGAVFDRIARHPGLYARIGGGYRRAALRRFPYVVVYRPASCRVFVVAVHHTSREPDLWRTRVQ